MRKLILLALVVASGTAASCGDDTPQPAKNKPGPAGGAAAAAKAVEKTATLVLKPKVDKQYRKELSPSDFQGDPTGDINRDPFESYLVAPQPNGPQTPVQDECQDHKVAEKFAYNDLSLVAIVVRGTRNFAMFKDPTGTGQIVFQGFCLSKEKARIIEITPTCVRFELRGDAPPGAPAPPAREDKNCLHKNDIEVQ
jgi:hypothetical protein